MDNTSSSPKILAGIFADDLTGAFDASSIDAGSLGRLELTPLLVDDFAFQSGDHTFTPNEPIEFEGLTPLLFLELADQINLHGDDVELIHMRSGGELVGSSHDEVTFRFLDFRAGASGGGQAIGQLAVRRSASLPRWASPSAFLRRCYHSDLDLTALPTSSSEA